MIYWHWPSFFFSDFISFNFNLFSFFLLFYDKKKKKKAKFKIMLILKLLISLYTPFLGKKYRTSFKSVHIFFSLSLYNRMKLHTVIAIVRTHQMCINSNNKKRSFFYARMVFICHEFIFAYLLKCIAILFKE